MSDCHSIGYVIIMVTNGTVSFWMQCIPPMRHNGPTFELSNRSFRRFIVNGLECEYSFCWQMQGTLNTDPYKTCSKAWKSKATARSLGSGHSGEAGEVSAPPSTSAKCSRKSAQDTHGARQIMDEFAVSLGLDNDPNLDI